MKLYDIVKQGAFVAPDRIAVTHGEKSITYKQLLPAISQIYERIKKLNLPAGSKAVIYYENSIDYVILFFAVTRAGLTIVPLDTSLKPEKINFILNDCDAKIIFVQNKFLRFLKEILEVKTDLQTIFIERDIELDFTDIPVEKLLNISDAEADEDAFNKLICNFENSFATKKITVENLPDCSTELAAIFYTSGSTGNPKGVMLSHLNLISNTVGTVEYLNLKSADSVLVILPFYYIYGNSLLLTHMICGGRLVIDNRFAFPQAVIETMVREEVSGFSGVPSNFMILLTNQNFTSEHIPSLTYITQAGGSLAPELIKKVAQVMNKAKFFVMYGQTEASPRVTYLPPDRLTEKLGSIGIEVPGVIIRLLDEFQKEVAQGEVGEIVVSGPNVMLGYCNQPEEQNQVLKNGMLFTGDLARCDKDGYYYIVSRKKEIIKVGGNRVSAKEIEERILEHNNIIEAAIISVEDDILGEAIKAFVVTDNNRKLTEKDIQEFVMLKLARHKAPKYVEFLKELPKYKSGKINKLALSEL